MKLFIVALLSSAGFVASAGSAGAQVVWHQPVHVVHSPVVMAPRPVVVHQRRPVVVHQPHYRAVTRHRPILGGSVTRVHRHYRPVIF